VWQDYAYGRNAVYDYGDHGNAILSRFPIRSSENEDVSFHRRESRGLLHCEIELPGSPLRFSRTDVDLRLPPPTLGEHSQEVRREFARPAEGSGTD